MNSFAADKLSFHAVWKESIEAIHDAMREEYFVIALYEDDYDYVWIPIRINL
jgi:hypothetical protein